MSSMEESTFYNENQHFNITEDFLIKKFKNKFSGAIHCYDPNFNSFVIKPNRKILFLDFWFMFGCMYSYFSKYAEYSNHIKNEIIYKKIDTLTFNDSLIIGNLKIIWIRPSRESEIYYIEKNKNDYKEFKIFNKGWTNNKDIKNKVLILLDKLLDYMFSNNVLPLQFIDYNTYLYKTKQNFDIDVESYYNNGKYSQKT